MADVVFILGAGCSVHAGAPVMANFLDKARNLLASGSVEDRRAEFETALRVISYLQRANSKAFLDHNNIESVFSAVDLARTIRKLPGIDAADIESAMSALKWLMVRTLEESIFYNTLNGRVRGTTEYETLARLINDIRGRTPPLSAAVLTFNYDLAADISFTWSGVPYRPETLS